MSQPRVLTLATSFSEPPLACGFPHLRSLRSPVVVLQNLESNTLVQRYVNISCPSGKRQRSIVTFRNHDVAAMFCIPCEEAWTEPTQRDELRNMSLDRAAESG